MSTLVICSGGLDSVTLAHDVAAKGKLGALLSFHYGQRHCKELVFAKACAERLSVPHHVIELSALTPFLTGSALTDAEHVAVPDGHYAAETMKDTVVPNRNAIMLTMAFGVAAGQGHDRVALAVHGGDHFIYPDCRPDFIAAFQVMQEKALGDMWSIGLEAPYLGIDKAGIVGRGAVLNVPFELTWSCYKGNDIHCGRCGTCVERAEAFSLAGVIDPTAYADKRFWKKAVAERGAA